jgi:23S rRNA pseudouridine1911/1915/1917 synthase
VTHVEAIAVLEGATLVRCRLETGRQHQIRIHLSELGHALVGETVYIRDHRGARITAPRLMLHATTLGFELPGDRRVLLSMRPPDDLLGTFARLGGKKKVIEGLFPAPVSGE